MLLKVTERVRERLGDSLPLPQEQIARRFLSLQEWEQTRLLSSLPRIAAMKGASELDAAALLSSDAPVVAAEDVMAVMRSDVVSDDS